MKIGALPQIQGRLYQKNPKSFAGAIKKAIEAEADKPNKLKSRIENINNVNIEIDSKEELQQTVKELNNIIQQLKQKPDAPNRGMVQQKNHSTFPIGNVVKGACFVCQKIGHRYMHCYNATPQQKQAITEQIETSKAQRRAKWDEKNRQSLNLSETTQDPPELSH
jgi:DNA repair ATPase RecN